MEFLSLRTQTAVFLKTQENSDRNQDTLNYFFRKDAVVTDSRTYFTEYERERNIMDNFGAESIVFNFGYLCSGYVVLAFSFSQAAVWPLVFLNILDRKDATSD